MSNPAFSQKTWTRIGEVTDVGTMTIEGTVNKSGFLILLTILGACVGWNLQSGGILIGSVIAAAILSFCIIFKPQRAAFLSQPYALLEGLFLGSLSVTYAARYPGIVTNALVGTLGCLAVMLVMYRFRIIRVTEKFKTVMLAATAAIAITYLVSMVMNLFGSAGVPMIHESSGAGIAFSVVVIGIAAFNLLLDFDLIEQMYNRQAPKFMEWYCSFALLLTLVWLYLEILRLLAKASKK